MRCPPPPRLENWPSLQPLLENLPSLRPSLENLGSRQHDSRIRIDCEEPFCEDSHQFPSIIRLEGLGCQEGRGWPFVGGSEFSRVRNFEPTERHKTTVPTYTVIDFLNPNTSSHLMLTLCALQYVHLAYPPTLDVA